MEKSNPCNKGSAWSTSNPCDKGKRVGTPCNKGPAALATLETRVQWTEGALERMVLIKETPQKEGTLVTRVVSFCMQAHLAMLEPSSP